MKYAHDAIPRLVFAAASLTAASAPAANLRACGAYFANRSLSVSIVMNGLQDALNAMSPVLYEGRAQSARADADQVPDPDFQRAIEELRTAEMWALIGADVDRPELQPTRASYLVGAERDAYLDEYRQGMRAFALLVGRLRAEVERLQELPPSARNYGRAFDLRMTIESAANRGHHALRARGPR